MRSADLGRHEEILARLRNRFEADPTDVVALETMPPERISWNAHDSQAYAASGSGSSVQVECVHEHAQRRGVGRTGHARVEELEREHATEHSSRHVPHGRTSSCNRNALMVTRSRDSGLAVEGGGLPLIPERWPARRQLGLFLRIF